MSDNNDNDKNPLVEISDLAGLSKPATALVNRLADGFGFVYKPIGTILQTKADAKAELIKAQTAIDVATLEGRAAIRVAHEQIRGQRNLESIIAKVVRDELDKNAAPEKIDDDWLGQFVNQAKHVSKEDMQSLWVKILAGEINAPGSFSKKTIDVASSLGHSDIMVFGQLCLFAVKRFYRAMCTEYSTDNSIVFSGVRSMDIENNPLVFNETQQLYQRKGVNFSSLQNMDSLGLLTYTPTGLHVPAEEIPTRWGIAGDGFVIAVDVPAGKNVPQGRVVFTRAGNELADVAKSVVASTFSAFSPSLKFSVFPEFPAYIMEEYKKVGVNCQLVKSEDDV